MISVETPIGRFGAVFSVGGLRQGLEAAAG
jgi:hypothetical protein